MADTTHRADQLKGLCDVITPLIVEKGWERLTSQDLLKHLQPYPDLKENIRQKTDLLDAVLSMAEERIYQASLSIDAPIKDKLFELLMTGYDALQPYKPFLQSVFCHDYWPLTRSGLLPRIEQLADSILEMASIDSSSWQGCLRAKGLMVIMATTTRCWLWDTTADDSRTLSTLDRYLDYGQEAAGFLGL